MKHSYRMDFGHVAGILCSIVQRVIKPIAYSRACDQSGAKACGRNTHRLARLIELRVRIVLRRGRGTVWVHCPHRQLCAATRSAATSSLRSACTRSDNFCNVSQHSIHGSVPGKARPMRKKIFQKITDELGPGMRCLS